MSGQIPRRTLYQQTEPARCSRRGCSNFLRGGDDHVCRPCRDYERVGRSHVRTPMALRAHQTILAPTAALPAMTANPLMTVIANNIQQQHEQIRFMLEDRSRQYEHQAQQYVRQAEEYLRQVQQYGQRIVQQYGQQYGHQYDQPYGQGYGTHYDRQYDQQSGQHHGVQHEDYRPDQHGQDQYHSQTHQRPRSRSPDRRDDRPRGYRPRSPPRRSEQPQQRSSRARQRHQAPRGASAGTSSNQSTARSSQNANNHDRVSHGHITSEQRPTAERVNEQLAAAPAQTQSAVALAPVQTQTNREPAVASAPPTLTIDNLGTAAIVRPMFPPSAPLTDATAVDIRPAFPPAEPLTTRPVAVPREDPTPTAWSFRPNA